ncbi:MAG: NAD-dependent epimerase/dehydratase family protein, partial [Flavobacterium sp.]
PALPEVDLVVHAAGKAHIVPRTLAEKNDFFYVNVLGTKHLLKEIEKTNTLPRSFLYISSVAVYGVDSGKNIDETHALEAVDPYGKSKIEAEAFVVEWCKKHNVICTIFRLPLLAGANPPGNLKSMIEGIKKGYYFNIGGGKARKSIVLAADVARLIPTAAKVGGIYNLTDGFHPSFYELSKVISSQLEIRKVKNMSAIIAKGISIVGDILGPAAPLNNKKFVKITSDLTFDDTKARKLLDWKPIPVLEGFNIY